MAHWAFDIADKIIEKKPNKDEYVCACGISPSGSVHIGNFRDVATSYFVAKALIARGKKAKLLLSWDDFDRLRKVPANVSGMVEGFEENLGKPYTMIKDPFGTDTSYGAHFEHEFENSLTEMGINLEIRRQTNNYTSGKYIEGIKTALVRRKEIYDIIMNYKTQDASQDEREMYFPISVYCDKSLKDNTKVLSYDNSTGNICCYCQDCGCKHTINVNNYKYIKLAWKIDWPMRWKHEGVDFEPGGIDHAAVNGSYDVAKEISKKIYDYDAPIFQGYGWLGIRGLGSMHSSTGNNITPEKVLQVYEPDIVKWLFAKYRPEDSFDFAFDDVVIRHYSEYDKLIARAHDDNLIDAERELLNILFGDNIPKNKTSFGNIVGIAPVVDFNPKKLSSALSKAGIDFDINSLPRVGKAKNWIEKYNPNKKYDLLEDFNKEYFDTLTVEEQGIICKLNESLMSRDSTESEIQQYLYSVINDPNLSKKDNVLRQKQNFKNIYNMLFGTDDGPRLYLFLSAVDKNKYSHLLGGKKKSRVKMLIKRIIN